MLVRSRPWIVADVVPSQLPADAAPFAAAHPQHLVHLACVQEDALGDELSAIWELEPGARVVERGMLPAPAAFDSPVQFDAFLDAVRWGAASTADIKSIQAPFRSGIDIEDYQLDPVVRAIRMPRANLLIADDVGLGKTIEAGLVVLELILRHRARRVLVVCPASLQIQWRDQMRGKFGLPFEIVDAEFLRRLRRERGIRANPWAHAPRLITSIDFLKRERPLRLFQETLPSGGAAQYPRAWDVLVLDEAHNCAPSGRGGVALDSQRTQVIRTLAPHFEHRLFLTATPHNGYVESFSALLELVDDQRFARGVAPERKTLQTVMVRRLKRELPPRFDGSPRFSARLPPIALEVDFAADERAVHAQLGRYTELRLAGATDAVERVATEFVLKTLKKRLFSCPAAFLTTLEKHAHSIANAVRKGGSSAPAARLLERQIDAAEEDRDDDEAIEEARGAMVDGASRLFRALSAEEADLLRRMRAWAAAASVRPDAKAAVLLRWIDENLRTSRAWTDQRVIVFTEYRATQRWLHERFAAAGLSAGDRVLLLYGGMDQDERERVKAAFQYDPRQSPVRILLATDAASEGIDLQNHCSRLIHYEIPWNPNRMEQRNGRIDRHGQRAPEVRIHHFVGSGFAERARRGGSSAALDPGDLDGDLEFLLRAALKVEQIREDLGKVGPVLAEQVEEAMLGRRRQLDTTAAEATARAARELTRFERDIRAEVKRLQDQLDETRREQRLDPENVQRVVETALALAGQPALVPARAEGIPEGRAFRLPAFSGTWAACAEGLRHPHTGVERPLVFDPALAQGRDDVVLAHLKHRLVDLSLHLLRAEVWASDNARRLHRATARLVPDSALRDPALIAHARLVVIGAERYRLHEEVIDAGGLLREGRFAALNVGDTAAALGAGLADAPSPAMQARLLGQLEKHREPLLRALDARLRERTKSIERALAERCEKEVDDIRQVLTELAASIRKSVDDPELRQNLLPGFLPEPEREQVERNVDFLKRRLVEIPGEIERETKALQARYAGVTPRLFPIAVTLLVPRRLAAG